MKSVFLLEHLNVISEDSESVKTIGMYKSKGDALSAIERLSIQPGFSDHPKLIDPQEDDEVSGFYIDEYEIGKDNWTEGYITV